MAPDKDSQSDINDEKDSDTRGNDSSREDSPKKQENTIHVRIPFKWREEDLRDVFKEHGEIKDVKIPQRNGRPAGYAFVIYDTQEACQKAIDKENGKKYEEFSIVVSLSEPRDHKESRPRGDRRSHGYHRSSRSYGRDRYRHSSDGYYRHRDHGHHHREHRSRRH